MSEQETKAIFPYHDGAEGVFGDPLRIERRMAHALDGDINAVLADCHSETDAVAFPAIDKLIGATIFAFELTPYDKKTGNGYTEEMCRVLLNRFMDWKEDQKKSTGMTPTCSPLSDDATLIMPGAAAFSSTCQEFASNPPLP
jgi:hypothetical protein